MLFNGRSEYLEKYGRIASEITAAGYHLVSIDWRGQGHSDRLLSDRRLGYVGSFQDYQRDVEAFISAVDALELPGPRFLIGHSMGGAISLRSLINGLDVKAAVFSAPMWGIFVPKHLRLLSHVLPKLADKFGQQTQILLGMSSKSYVLATAFEDLKLTTDMDHFEYLKRHALADEDFALGGATYQWYREARQETRSFRNARLPDIPAQVYVGAQEGIVDRKAIARISNTWPTCERIVVPDSKHELMMEAPIPRQAFMDGMVEFFAKNAD